MKKIHYDKFGDGYMWCGTRFAEHVTDKREEVTCEKCQDIMHFRLKDIPYAVGGWVGGITFGLISLGLERLFGESSKGKDVTAAKPVFRDEVGREYRYDWGWLRYQTARPSELLARAPA